MYKYTLIISQYYHSYHQFIVKYDDNFLDNARKFVRELITYKRGFYDDIEYLGDLDYKYKNNTIKQRYNINDYGDIYFINHNTIQNLIHDVNEYNKKCIELSKGYKRKIVQENIFNHHNYDRIKEIVQKYFDIV